MKKFVATTTMVIKEERVKMRIINFERRSPWTLVKKEALKQSPIQTLQGKGSLEAKFGKIVAREEYSEIK